MSGRLLALFGAAVLLAACTGDDGPELDTARVGPAEVVQTVAAPAELAPAARAPVTTGVAGEIVALEVADGDHVDEGEVLMRLTSEELEDRVDQAEQAVETARSAGGAAAGVGAAPDLAPVIGSLRGQLDTTLPELIGVLDAQVGAAEGALEAAVLAVVEAAETRQEARAELIAKLEDSDVVEVVDGLDLDSLPSGPDVSAAVGRLEQARATVETARAGLARAQASFRQASQELAEVEAGLADQAAAAEAAQQAAVEAQVAEAQAALAAVEDRLDELTIVAPISGVVQLERGEPVGAPGDGLGGLEGFGGLEGLGGPNGAAGRFGDSALDGLDGLDGAGDRIDRALTVGTQLGAGQLVATVFDLSSFTAEVEVDELDVVELAVGQPVEISVDAFPGETLRGEVERIAIEPLRDVAGGARYPVSVELTDVPAEVELRVGLTAAVEIEVARVDAELAVPTSALLRRGEAEVVYAVRDGVAEEVPVDLVAIGDQEAAITGDVEPGETVVTTGVELVSDGDEVEVDG